MEKDFIHFASILIVANDGRHTVKSIVAGVFRNKYDAQDAINDLLAFGFTNEQIQAREESDFEKIREQPSNAVIRPRTENAWLGDLFRSLTGKDDELIWEKGYSLSMGEGEVVLMVEASSEEKADRAAEVLNRHSPFDVEELYTMPDVEAHFAHWSNLRPPVEEANAGSSGSLRGKSPVRRQGKVFVFPRQSIP